jgi:hypothetical protein
MTWSKEPELSSGMLAVALDYTIGLGLIQPKANVSKPHIVSDLLATRLTKGWNTATARGDIGRKTPAKGSEAVNETIRMSMKKPDIVISTAIGITFRRVAARESESVAAIPNMLMAQKSIMCGEPPNLSSPVHAIFSGDVADVRMEMSQPGLAMSLAHRQSIA